MPRPPEVPLWKRPPLLIGVGVLVALVAFIYLRRAADAPPSLKPDETTSDRLAVIASALTVYVATHQKIPQAIGDLGSATKDGWGSAFVLSSQSTGPLKASVSIRSPGPDKAPNTDDDRVLDVQIGDDGYGKLGVASSNTRQGK